MHFCGLEIHSYVSIQAILLVAIISSLLHGLLVRCVKQMFYDSSYVAMYICSYPIVSFAFTYALVSYF